MRYQWNRKMRLSIRSTWRVRHRRRRLRNRRRGRVILICLRATESWYFRDCWTTAWSMLSTNRSIAAGREEPVDTVVTVSDRIQRRNYGHTLCPYLQRRIRWWYTVMILHRPGHWVTVMSDAKRFLHWQFAAAPAYSSSNNCCSCSHTMSTATGNWTCRSFLVCRRQTGRTVECVTAELVCGQGVAGLRAPFDVAAVRRHLERCLEEQVMTPLPRDASHMHEKWRHARSQRQSVRTVVYLDTKLEIIIFIYVHLCGYWVWQNSFNICAHFVRKIYVDASLCVVGIQHRSDYSVWLAVIVSKRQWRYTLPRKLHM